LAEEDLDLLELDFAEKEKLLLIMLSFIIYKYLSNLPCEFLLLDLDPSALETFLEELFLLSFPDERESFTYNNKLRIKKQEIINAICYTHSFLIIFLSTINTVPHNSGVIQVYVYYWRVMTVLMVHRMTFQTFY